MAIDDKIRDEKLQYDINREAENIKVNHDDDKIRGEKLQYDINREAAIISALSSR